MILADLRQRVHIGVDRDDLQDQYDSIINEALKDIQVRKSWLAMRQKDELLVLSGEKTVNMPDDFKEITPGKFPVYQVTPGGVLIPVYLYPREKAERLAYRFGSLVASTDGGRISVYIDQEDDQWFLGIPSQASQDLTFRVSYYRFLPKLEDDHHDNSLTREYPEMVINRAKAIAFALVNDPNAELMNGIYDMEFKKAAATDRYKQMVSLNNEG